MATGGFGREVPGGAGDGSGAFGARLRPGDGSTGGLFIFGDETDPSWHLRGVERQIEEAAVRASLTFPGAGGSQSLVMRFGDTSRDDNRYRAHLAFPYSRPETVNRDVVQYRQHPDPSARTAQHVVNAQLTVRAALAGVPGNAQRLLVREGLAGRNLRFSGTEYLNATDPDDSSRTGNTLSLQINSNDAEDYNGATVSVRAPTLGTATATATADVRGSTAVINTARNIKLDFHEAGTHGNGFEVVFQYSANGNGISGAFGAAASYASATRLNVYCRENIALSDIVNAVNAARHNGEQLIVASAVSAANLVCTWHNVSTPVVTATLAGGAGTKEANRAIWTDNGAASTLVIVSDGTYNVTQIAAAINAISDFPGTAAVFGSGRADWLLDVPQAPHTFSGAQNARARTPLAVGESVANSVRTLSITGVVPGVDTIANLIAAYTDSTKHYEIVGTGTDFAILAADSQGNNDVLFNGALSGGRAALNREDTVVDVLSRDGNTGAVTYTVTIYGSDSPLAHRTTLNELRAAWLAEIRTVGGDAPTFSLSGDGSDQLDVSSLPASPSGGRNYVPPSPIEFLVRGEDEADGKNIEVRYHHDHDTQQEILDASLIPAQNPGGAKVIDIYGTDLTVMPEEPGFSRRMYPEDGEADSGPDSRSESIAFDNQATVNAGSDTQLGIAAQTVDVIFPEDETDAEIITAIDASNDAFTVAAGLYLAELTGEGNPSGATGVVAFYLQTASGDEELEHFGPITLPAANAWNNFTENTILALGEDTAIYGNFSAIARNTQLRGVKLKLTRWGGSNAAPAPASPGLTLEQVRDAVAAFLREGTNITIVHDDNANTLTISSTAAGGTGGGLTAEEVRDTVAAFVNDGRGISVTHDDGADTLTIALNAASESNIGGVRNVSNAEASAPEGTVFRAWSSAMITKVIAVWRTVMPTAEAEAGSSNVARFMSAAVLRAAINAVVPAVFRTGNTARIDPAKLGSGARDGTKFLRDDGAWIHALGGLMREVFNGQTGAVTTEQRAGDDYQVPDSNNTVLLVQIGNMREFYAGDDFSALREADGETLNGVTIYSNAQGHFLLKQPTAASRIIRIWIVEDVEAFADIAARFLPTVSEADAQGAIDAATSQQRRIFTVQRVIQTIIANRNPQSLVGGTVRNGELVLNRQSGQDPLDLRIGGSKGGVELEQIGNRFTAAGGATYQATGITLEDFSGGNFVWIRAANPGDGDPPLWGILLGATFAGMTQKSAGDAAADADSSWGIAWGGSAASIKIVRTAAGELLASSPDASTGWWLEVYEQTGLPDDRTDAIPDSPLVLVCDATRRRILGNSVTNDVGIASIRTPSPFASNLQNAANTIDLEPGVYIAVAMSSIFTTSSGSTQYDENVRFGIGFQAKGTGIITNPLSLNYARTIDHGDSQVDRYGAQSRSCIFHVGSTDDRTVAFESTYHGELVASDPQAWLDWDTITIYKIGETVEVTSQAASNVSANPAGEDGAVAKRLRIDGRNWNLPVFSPEPIATADFGNTVSGQVDTFRLQSSGDGIDKPDTIADGEIWAIKSSDDEGVGTQFYIFEASDIPETAVEAGAGIATGGVYIYTQGGRGVKIAFNAAGKMVVAADHGNTEIGNLTLWRWGYGGVQAVTPSTHDRFIGWSAAQVPTASERAAGVSHETDVLTIPTRNTNGYIWFAVPKTQGQPTGVYLSGNSVNQIGAYTRLNDQDFGGESHFVYATNAEQNASVVGTGTFTLRIEYGS